MIVMTILVSIVSVFEIRSMVKKKLRREMIVFIVIAVLSLLLGYVYLSDPTRRSLARMLFNLVGTE